RGTRHITERVVGISGRPAQPIGHAKRQIRPRLPQCRNGYLTWRPVRERVGCIVGSRGKTTGRYGWRIEYDATNVSEWIGDIGLSDRSVRIGCICKLVGCSIGLSLTEHPTIGVVLIPEIKDISRIRDGGHPMGRVVAV